MSRTAKWFWALVAAQALFLVAWAGYHEWVRQSAPVILLKGRPVDPQDLLRGDYMTLAYDISDAPVAGVTSKVGEQADAGAEVWVLLEKRDRYHVVAEASRKPLTPKSGQTLVRGTLGYNWRGNSAAARIEYGIEHYFVPEGKGSPRFKLVEIEASVSPTQQLYIRRVLLDGKPYP